MIWFAALVGAAVCGTLLWQRLFAPLPPLEVSLWYWHQPFRILPQEAAEWKALGVRQLFVQAGSFRKDASGIHMALPQIWETAGNGLAVHLVFHLDGSLAQEFSTLDLQALETPLLDGIRREREAAEHTGVKVAGVQLDFDCPTRQLPKYADLLRDVRKAVASESCALSITALPTWYGSRLVDAPLAQVDFAVPQYYEPELPKSLDKFATVSRLSLVEHGLRAAGRQGAPFYAGLPVYGHSLLYDAQGQLAGTYHRMGALDAFRHPAFRLARAFGADANGAPATPETAIGETLYDFVAVAPAKSGRGVGFHLVYDLPTPTLLARHLALVRAQRPRNCRGVILFRYPEARETATLPLPTLQAVLQGKTPHPQLKVEIQARALPWEQIETGRKVERAPQELALTVTNVGKAATALGPDAVTVTLLMDRPGIADLSAGDADSVETFSNESRDVSDVSPGQRVGLLRANVVRFHKLCLMPGESVKFGPLRLPADSAAQAQGSWSVADPDHFIRITGAIAPTPLAREAQRP